jgi:hypothetical protein
MTDDNQVAAIALVLENTSARFVQFAIISENRQM